MTNKLKFKYTKVNNVNLVSLVVPNAIEAKRIWDIFLDEDKKGNLKVSKVNTEKNFMDLVGRNGWPSHVMFASNGNIHPVNKGDSSYNVYFEKSAVPLEEFYTLYEYKGLRGTMDSLDELIAQLEKMENQ